MTLTKSGAQPIAKPAVRSANMKMLRTVAGYVALAVGVSVGGVIVGAIVVAPAVSRATPLFSKSAAQGTETTGSIGQADGDGAASTSAANTAASESFKPITEAIAAAKQLETTQARPRRTGFEKFKHEAGYFYEDALDLVRGVPKIMWVYVDVALVALFAAAWFYRRRRAGSTASTNAMNAELPRRSVAALPVKLVPGKGSRTPKAVAALAEAGTTPADIARRTGLPHDAVSMLLSLGSFGARQLQPPTA